VRLVHYSLDWLINAKNHIPITFFSVVEFANADDAARAIKEYEGYNFEGRTLRVRQVSLLH